MFETKYTVKVIAILFVVALILLRNVDKIGKFVQQFTKIEIGF